MPAFVAIGSKIGQPIVEGDDILTIIPATAPAEKINQALETADNAVLMKVYKNFSQVTAVLAENNLAENAVLVSRAGLDGERIIHDLAKHTEEKLNYLSTILTRKHD